MSAGAVAVAAPGYNFTLSPLPLGLVRRTPHNSGAAAAPQPKFCVFHTHDHSRLLRIPTEEPTPEQIEAAVQAAVQYFDEEQLRNALPMLLTGQQVLNLLHAALQLAGVDGGTPRIPNYALVAIEQLVVELGMSPTELVAAGSADISEVVMEMAQQMLGHEKFSTLRSLLTTMEPYLQAMDILTTRIDYHDAEDSGGNDDDDDDAVVHETTLDQLSTLMADGTVSNTTLIWIPGLDMEDWKPLGESLAVVHYQTEDGKARQTTLDQLPGLMAANEGVAPDTLVWTAGMDDWIRMGDAMAQQQLVDGSGGGGGGGGDLQQAVRMSLDNASEAEKAEVLRRAWQRADVDGSGMLEPAELRDILVQMGRHQSEGGEVDLDLEAEMGRLDTDGSGAVSFDEFSVWFMQFGSSSSARDSLVTVHYQAAAE
eukprot:COSAG02_NODE_552_length_20429_cov_28.014068_3_plen_425_part_00